MTQLVARDDITRALEHETKNLERLILKAHQPRAVAQFTRPAIELV
jgi:hypothetical protein